ncbi:MAG TPA: type II toxin-antitoxin system PemK/MazF family toxin [Candidatus Gracilibacteria bacterium]
MPKVKRGEIYMVSFDPSRGSEQSGTRPAIIIQNNIGNLYANTTIIAALSTRISDYPQNVIIEPSKENGLPKKSCAKLDQILTISQQRLSKKLGQLTSEEMLKVNTALKLSLELN